MSSRAPVHRPGQILLSKGGRRWKRNMVSSKQRLVEVGDDGSHWQSGCDCRWEAAWNREGTWPGWKQYRQPKTPRLGGQGGLDTSGWGKRPGAGLVKGGGESPGWSKPAWTRMRNGGEAEGQFGCQRAGSKPEEGAGTIQGRELALPRAQVKPNFSKIYIKKLSRFVS